MMEDRKLLELAAKAAGMKGEYHSHDCDDGLPPLQFLNIDGGRSWAPLDDDGDALRLAVKLGLSWSFVYTGFVDLSFLSPVPGSAAIREPVGEDRCQAVRRLIVRAAAEIGKGMK